MKARYHVGPAGYNTESSAYHRILNYPYGRRDSQGCLNIDSVVIRPDDNVFTNGTINSAMAHDIQCSHNVFRRGQPFYMDIIFKGGNFDARLDVLFIEFNYGPNPWKCTQFTHPSTLPWSTQIQCKAGNIITVKVDIPVDCQVGRWHCIVDTVPKGMPPTGRRHNMCLKDVFVLFNPYSPDDCVYMPNEADRNDFLLTENSPSRLITLEDSLEAASNLLERSRLTPVEQASPIKVTRAICSKIQADLLYRSKTCSAVEQNHQFSVSDSSPPIWTRSVRTMDQFLDVGSPPPSRHPRYRAMAGLITSVCGALGLPARPITSYIGDLEDRGDWLSLQGDVKQIGNDYWRVRTHPARQDR